MASHLAYSQTPPNLFRYDSLPSPPMSSKLSKVAPVATKTRPLLTPPNSQDVKTYHDFAQRENEDIRQDTGVLFPPTQDTITPSPQQLFATTVTLPSARTHLSNPYETALIKSWASQEAPDWARHTSNGLPRLPGIHTWQDLKIQEANNGNDDFTKPTEEEYQLVASFVQEMKQTGRRPLVESTNRKRSKVTKPTSTIHHRAGSNARLQTPSLAKATAASPRRLSRTANNKSGGRLMNTETKSARAPSSKPPKDPEWRNYPDYAPKDEHMDSRAAYQAVHDSKNFAEHKKAFDLSEDPERDYLNAAEKLLCERLALDCHRFLTSKRQIFQGFVKHLQTKADVDKRVRDGLEDRGQSRLPSWNKTAAQSLMGIDVTKGSHIWTFYNEVGFFNEKLFAHFIHY